MTGQKLQLHRFLYFFLHSIASLVLGTLTYVLFRSDTYLAQFFYSMWDIESFANTLQAESPYFLRYFLQCYLPDITWAYALTYTAYGILCKEHYATVCTFTVASLSIIGIEFCQKYSIISGTFDPLDILFELCTTALATLLIKKHFKGEPL